MKHTDKTKEQHVSESAEHLKRIAELEERLVTCSNVEKSTLAKELKTIFENVPFGIVYLNNDFRIISSNKFFNDFTGFKEGELIGRLCYEIVGEYSDDPSQKGPEKICSFCKKAECFKSKRPTVIERPLGDKFVRVTTIPELDENGEIWRFMEIVEDITERNKTTEKLIRAKEQWEQTFDTIPDMILVSDQDHRIIRANQALADRTGIRREDLIGRSCYDVVHGTEEPPTSCPHHKTMATGKQHTDEVFEEKLKGHFQISATPFLDTEGKAIGIVEVVRDITERKQAEELLSERGKLHKLTSDVSLIWIKKGEIQTSMQACADTVVAHLDAAFTRIWLLNQDNNVLELKASAGMYTHLDGEHGRIPVGKFKIGLIAEERKPHLTNEVIGDPRVGNQEWARRERMVSFAGYPLIVDGRLLGVLAMFARHKLSEYTLDKLGVVADRIATGISRKQADEMLKASEERYRNLYRGTPVMMHSIDSKGRLVSVSDYWLDTLGYNRGEVIGRRSTEFLTDASRRYAQEVVLPDFLKTCVSKDIEYQFVKKNGEVIDTLLSAIAEQDSSGQVLRSLAVIINVTDRKRLEEEKNKLQTQLQQGKKIESIGIFAGGIAHDFNNLLTGIISNIYLSKMYVKPESKAYDNLKSAEKAIHRATNLTHQLLTFAKGGAPVKKVTSVEAIIKESSEFVLSGSNNRCEYNVADNLLLVEVDEGQISQAIQNLILNGKQAMPDGGTIRIRIDNYNFGPDNGLPLRDGKYIKILIQDQGAGIPEEHLQKIFDPYFTTKEAGQGLGLSITYSIIKNHSGYISAESEMGVGTTFTIYLPASEKQIEKIESTEDTFIMGQGKILLMDDEEMIRESIGSFLTMSGYEVEYAENGEKALELFEEAIKTAKPFDAVILDLTIRGGMGGKETIKKLLEIDPNVKAIVSSGYSNDPVMANFREYGFSDVITKPCRRQEDLNKILHKVIKG